MLSAASCKRFAQSVQAGFPAPAPIGDPLLDAGSIRHVYSPDLLGLDYSARFEDLHVLDDRCEGHLQLASSLTEALDVSRSTMLRLLLSASAWKVRSRPIVWSSIYLRQSAGLHGQVSPQLFLSLMHVGGQAISSGVGSLVAGQSVRQRR